MTNGPLPPHERSWRHPSELPGPPPEPATRGGRLLIVAVGTVGLVLVGVLALTMTPRRADQAGDAVVTTTLALLAPAVVTGDVASAPPATVGATLLASTSVLAALGVTSSEPRATVVATLRPGGEGPYDASSTVAATAAASATTGAPLTTATPATTAAPTTAAPASTAPVTTAALRLATAGPATSGYAGATSADTAGSGRLVPDAPPAGTVDTVVDTVVDSAPDTVPAAVVATSPTTDGDDPVAPARVAPAFPLVTPVGPDGLAITTHAACTSCTRGSMSATLPSGSVVGVQVIDPDGRFVVVSLPADAGYSAMSVADASRAPSSMSVMYDGVYTPIDPDSAGALCTPEAAPVLDDHGQLVGLCTASDDGASIVPVDSLPPIPAASTPPTDAATTTIESSTTTLVTTTTVAPTTVAPGTVAAG